MKVDIEVDKNIKETMIKIKTSEVTEKIKELANKIQNMDNNNNSIVAIQNEKMYILYFKEIESIYASDGKVIIIKDNQEYISKKKIYEFEDMLKDSHKYYIRISNSEIANFKKVESLDLSIRGTIKLLFESGYTTYVSRRNIQKIKKYFNI